jgi:segregation and condensation protein B
MSFEKSLLRQIIEGALLAAGQPLSVDKLLSLFGTEETAPDEERPSKTELHTALEEIQADCQGRGFELVEVGSGWRFQVRKETAPWVNRLWDEKPQKYSRALLETLSLIAYRQPITRGDIEEIRGVAVSSHIIKTLTEREWVKVVGHRDVPGRPSLYATTRGFLDYFNLKSLEELPSLSEIQDLDSLNVELDLELENTVAAVLAANEDLTVEAEEQAAQGVLEEPAFAQEGLSEAELAEAYVGEDVPLSADDERTPYEKLQDGGDPRDAEDPESSATENTNSGRDSLFAPSNTASVFDESN